MWIFPLLTDPKYSWHADVLMASVALLITCIYLLLKRPDFLDGPVVRELSKYFIFLGEMLGVTFGLLAVVAAVIAIGFGFVWALTTAPIITLLAMILVVLIFR